MFDDNNKVDVPLDEELGDIYLEESNEIIGFLNKELTILKGDFENKSALKEIRRHFHTLKGSGRMVGLIYMGEVAWFVEQTLNKWTNEEKPANKDLIDMIESVMGSFKVWVDELTANKRAIVNAILLLSVIEKNNSELNITIDIGVKNEIYDVDIDVEALYPFDEAPVELIESVSENTSTHIFLKLDEPIQSNETKKVEIISDADGVAPIVPSTESKELEVVSEVLDGSEKEQFIVSPIINKEVEIITKVSEMVDKESENAVSSSSGFDSNLVESTGVIKKEDVTIDDLIAEYPNVVEKEKRNRLWIVFGAVVFFSILYKVFY